MSKKTTGQANNTVKQTKRSNWHPGIELKDHKWKPLSKQSHNSGQFNSTIKTLHSVLNHVGFEANRELVERLLPKYKQSSKSK